LALQPAVSFGLLKNVLPFFLSVTISLYLLTPSTFLGLHLCIVPSSCWVNIFLGILSSFILSR
jgi:hypothetical protein